MDTRERRRAAIQGYLTQSTAQPAGVPLVALDVWGQVVEQLVPVIGLQGVDALLNRSLQIAGMIAPWPAKPAAKGEPYTPLATLGKCLAPSPEVNLALLVTFTDLLANLIGEALTDRMLDPIWIAPPLAYSEEIMRGQYP
jgi:hypothetical protein